MTAADVYVITLQFDAPNFEWLQALRRQHFPSSRNWLPAHLTLLHAVSVDQTDRLKQRWHEFGQFRPPALRFTGVKSLGRGTAIVVDSPTLHPVRALVMQVMEGEFSRQDLQAFRPHVTVQNKVDPTAARSLFDEMSASFVTREGTGEGVMVWRYLGGPWSLDTVLPFR